MSKPASASVWQKEAKCSEDLATRLRLYFNETSKLRYYEQNSKELMIGMTPTLRGESSHAGVAVRS